MKKTLCCFKLPGLLLSIWVGLNGAAAWGATTNVVASGFSFVPKVITIHAGDTVIWTGLAGFHSVTGSTPPETLCGNSFPASCTNTFNTPGSYSYICINHAVSFGMTGLVNVVSASVPPFVSITNPPAALVFAAPAMVNIGVLATNAANSVTNVEFFSNGSSLGVAMFPPFQFFTPLLEAGDYALTAVAKDASGLTATSAPVNLSVVTPVAVTNYSPRITNGRFVFDHSANPGLRYVLESSATLTSWTPVTTNTAVSNSVEASDAFQVGGLRFYRVGRLPNP